MSHLLGVGQKEHTDSSGFARLLRLGRERHGEDGSQADHERAPIQNTVIHHCSITAFRLERVRPGVDFLAALATDGTALELGIGTGRIALPLLQRGIKVHGIDSSPAMISKLRDKPHGDQIPVTLGNFADMPIDGMFTLIFAAYNTFFGVRSQDDQVRCFAGIAEHLSESGAFVIEVFVPDLTFSIVGNKSACSKSKRTAFTSTLSSTIRFDRV